MTAIAYRDGIMAADTLTTGGDAVRGYMNKIVRSPDGTLGAAAGPAGMTRNFRNLLLSGKADHWIGEGCSYRLLETHCDRGGFGGLIVPTSGKVICIDYMGFGITDLEAPFSAEGGAEYILLGALAHGATAEEAVRIAITYDLGCGGEVQVEHLDLHLT